MHTRFSLLVLVTSAGVASHAMAQLSESGAARVQLQVFNPDVGTWSSSIGTAPGSRVEWRVVVSYTGTNTSVYALGQLNYQPVFSFADNSGPTFDDHAAWRNGGEQSVAIAGSLLSEAEGASGSALPSYGAVRFGGVAMTGSRRITNYRHGGDWAQNGAPAGSWLRVASGTVNSDWWPGTTPPGPSSIPGVGLVAGQAAAINPVTGLPNLAHITGTQNLVVFRGALLLSGDAIGRAVTIDIPQMSLSQLVNSNVGYMSWQTSQSDGGSWRTGVVIEPATIFIPAPGVAAMVGAATLFGVRRKR